MSNYFSFLQLHLKLHVDMLTQPFFSFSPLFSFLFFSTRLNSTLATLLPSLACLLCLLSVTLSHTHTPYLFSLPCCVSSSSCCCPSPSVSVFSSPAVSPELPPRYLLGQGQRPNTITHVCWYRNQNLSLNDYLRMTQVPLGPDPSQRQALLPRSGFLTLTHSHSWRLTGIPWLTSTQVLFEFI